MRCHAWSIATTATTIMKFTADTNWIKIKINCSEWCWIFNLWIVYLSINFFKSWSYAIEIIFRLEKGKPKKKNNRFERRRQKKNYLFGNSHALLILMVDGRWWTIDPTTTLHTTCSNQCIPILYTFL